MFIWILVVVILVAFVIYNWAELGQGMRGRTLVMVCAWPVAALLLWRVALRVLHLHSLIAFALLLLVLVLGYYQLRHSNPRQKRPPLPKKNAPKRQRQRKHH